MPIKSFQGHREKSIKAKTKTLLVEDIMSRNLIVFKPEETIHEVMKKFIKYRISGGPVVNEKGDLIGVISEADCMKEVSESRYFNLPILDKSVSNFMTTNVDTIDASKTIFEAASNFFNDPNCGCKPVLLSQYRKDKFNADIMTVSFINENPDCINFEEFYEKYASRDIAGHIFSIPEGEGNYKDFIATLQEKRYIFKFFNTIIN